MSKNVQITPAVETYLHDVITRESPLLRRLREETAYMPQYRMQITPEQGAFMAMLARLTSAKRILEIGTFTGYSALAMAEALPEDGRIITCDVNAEWTHMAQRYWQEAGVSRRIELRLGDAGRTLAALLQDGQAGAFDMAFIDADKNGYDGYYESALQLLKRGGLIALDNMLWSGAVADETEHDKRTVILRNLNAKIRDDTRVDACLLPLADGIMLARKR